MNKFVHIHQLNKNLMDELFSGVYLGFEINTHTQCFAYCTILMQEKQGGKMYRKIYMIKKKKIRRKAGNSFIFHPPI